jgi:hypothetical protein
LRLMRNLEPRWTMMTVSFEYLLTGIVSQGTTQRLSSARLVF